MPSNRTGPDRSKTLGHALRDSTFWWLAGSFFLQSFASVAVGVILIPYLTDRGDDPAFAAAATGLIGAAQVLSRILSTIAGDRIPAVTLTALVFAIQAIALGVLMGWQGRAGLLLAVLMLGAGRGVVTLVRPQLVADFYGRSHFGAINGTLALVLSGSRSLAPIGIGLAVGVVGSYTPVLWAMATLSILATATMLVAGQRRQRSLASPATQPGPSTS
jgi:MFS family permease